MRPVQRTRSMGPLVVHLGVLVASPFALATCDSGEETTDARGGGAGGGGLATGQGGAASSGGDAGPTATGPGGEGGGDSGGTVLVTVAASSSASTGYGPDPEGTCSSDVSSGYPVDECLEAACCEEFNLCSDFGHDEGACASCLQAGGGLRCDEAIDCMNLSGCMDTLCPDGKAYCFGGDPHHGIECIDASRFCDGVPDCSTSASDEATCD